MREPPLTGSDLLAVIPCRTGPASAVRLAGDTAHTLPFLEAISRSAQLRGRSPVARRRIQPKPTVELETVTLRLPVQLVRAIDHYAKYLGGSTDRTYVMAQAIEIAMAQDRDFQKTTSRAAGAVPGAVRVTA
jgi:hypothetical protein